ncbi:carbohydrate ABC transporter substrate-binding protein [Cohnella endophytica]|uniref:Carbohydrate ABC transporter substrate-binding protein n=1 Tax=Cohnella endophytica TaxID=2419778 RepID=A0A494Y7I2_9BACL|nr:ABC transporter substrate-binding protein [Cohnella endophytica]RKP56278.1 carbohydrate ABC transporter substrate-binding protein [Cohnella endophytica]
MRFWLVTLMLIGLILLLTFNVWFFYASSNSSHQTATPKETVHLKLLANQSWINRPFLQNAIRDYEKSTGVVIDIQAVPSNSADSIIKKKFSADVLADIVLFNGGAQLEALHPTQNFVDLNEESWVSDVEPFALPLITNNFNVYGFPLWEGALSGIVYNKEIFKKYDIEIPRTKDEFFQACVILRANGIIPMYMAFRDIWPLYLEYGIDAITAQDDSMVKRLNWNQLKLTDIPEMIQLLEWYDKLAKENDLGEGFQTNNWDGQAEALSSGKYAMAIETDTYIYNELENEHAGIASSFGLMPFYFGFNGKGSYARNNLISIFVNQKSKHVKEALDFVRSTAKPDRLNEAYRGIYTQPPFKSVHTNKWTPEYLEVQKLASSRVIAPAAANLIVGFSPVEISVPVQEMMLGEITPEQALQKMENIRFQNAQNQGTPGF